VVKPQLRVVRTQALTISEQVEAVFSNPGLYELAVEVPMRQPTGRHSEHPAWALLAYGVLARVFRSGAKVEGELADPATWARVLDVVGAVRAAHPDLDIPPAAARPPAWDAWKHARNHYFTDPEVLQTLQQRFTELAVAQARGAGLLDPSGPGPLCHPDRSRLLYGDGTVVRPMYRPPPATRTTDPVTGEVTITYLDPAGKPIPAPTHRFDPDAADHHGHTGSVHGQNYVGLYCRGEAAHSRIVLAVARVARPGLEADTAVAAVKALHAITGPGILAVVYDGAMRGTHIDDLMTSCGLLVINKVHSSAKTAARKGRTAPTPRWFTLGTWEHDTPTGACTHQLAAVDGAVCQVSLDVAGKPVVVGRLARKQVKRSRRGTGLFHFNVAYDVPCPGGSFLAWVTPHGEPGDQSHRRADAVRVIAEGEAAFAKLYSIRSDSESFNSQLKRTLLVNRAMSLGGRRQLLDFLCFGVLRNSEAAYRARAATAQRELAGRAIGRRKLARDATAQQEQPRLTA